MVDEFAFRVLNTYLLKDDFRGIAAVLSASLEPVRAGSKAPREQQPTLKVGDNLILIRAEYYSPSEPRLFCFNVVGRVIAGREIGQPGPFYLQTFRSPDQKATIPNPNLETVLGEYIRS